jgi:LuxR family maltose regulon positive regulatory protein
VLSDPQLCFEYCWPLILTDQIEAAERYLAVAEAAASEAPSLWGEIAVARAHIARAQGDGPRVIEFSERALSLLPAEDLSSRSIVAINLGIAQWYRGRLDESVRALSEAQRAASGSGNGYVRTTARVFRARIEAVRGGPYRAADAYRRAIREGGQSPAVAMAHIDLGKLLYEWNDLDAAAGHLQQALDLCRSAGSVEIQLSAAVVLALVLQRLERLVEAHDVLQESWSLAQHRDVSPFGRLNALGYRALIALAAGDPDQAARWVEQYPAIKEIPSLPQCLLLCLARARLLLAQGRRAEAARVLAARYGVASQAGFDSALGETRAMQALVAPTPGEARAHLSQALAAAEPEGRVRTFLDLGQPMADLLQQAVAHGIAAGYSSKLLAAFQPSGAQGPGPRPRPGARRDHKPAALNSKPEPLEDPLSERELEALRLLAAGYTYQEIAQALYVSVNTVKTHLKNIYAKLRVHTRRQATAKARELGLIANHP